jgi:hypothetical protein
MSDHVLAQISRLPDAELVARLKSLAAGERGLAAELVAHLAELDTRDLHLRAGYGSLFVYCRDALALTEGEAYARIEVARAVRRFPLILERLSEGAVNMTTVRLLAPHLTPENHARVLDLARGMRKAQVEELAARLAPRPDVPAFVRRLPLPRPAPVGEGTPSPGPAAAAPMRFAPPPPSDHRPTVAPLAPYRYRLQVTIDGACLEKLRLAKDMLRHVLPSGDDAAILDRALTALLADLARKKFAAVDTPRPAPGTAAGSRHIPAEVKRVVWLRDLGRCAFVSEDGRRCNERGFLEFHHVTPHAAGGEATVENIQLRCRRHNSFEARVYYGKVKDQGDRVREGSGCWGR